MAIKACDMLDLWYLLVIYYKFVCEVQKYKVMQINEN